MYQASSPVTSEGEVRYSIESCKVKRLHRADNQPWQQMAEFKASVPEGGALHQVTRCRAATLLCSHQHQMWSCILQVVA